MPPQFSDLRQIDLAVALSRRTLRTIRQNIGIAIAYNAIMVPLAAMLVSDLVMGMVLGFAWGFHDTQLWVYGSMAAISVLGLTFRNRGMVTTSVVGGTISGVLFYAVTNFSVWYGGTLYPQTAEGLVACYAAGAAFYRDGGNFLLNTVLSTVVFSAAAFALAMLVRVDKSRNIVQA